MLKKYKVFPVFEDGKAIIVNCTNPVNAVHAWFTKQNSYPIFLGANYSKVDETAQAPCKYGYGKKLMRVVSVSGVIGVTDNLTAITWTKPPNFGNL